MSRKTSIMELRPCPLLWRNIMHAPLSFIYPHEDAGGLSREYVLRIPSVSYKATKGAPLYSHSR